MILAKSCSHTQSSRKATEFQTFLLYNRAKAFTVICCLVMSSCALDLHRVSHCIAFSSDKLGHRNSSVAGYGHFLFLSSHVYFILDLFLCQNGTSFSRLCLHVMYKATCRILNMLLISQLSICLGLLQLICTMVTYHTVYSGIRF